MATIRCRERAVCEKCRLEFLGKINNASVPTRYPEDLQRMLTQYPESVVRDYLEETEEVLKWLRQHPNLQ